MTKINCDLGYEGEPYSCGGSMRIRIYNADFEPMIEARLHDGSASEDNHRTRGQAYKWNDIGTSTRTYHTDYTEEVDIDNDYFGVKMDGGKVYVYYPDAIPPTDEYGWRYVNIPEASARDRGSMTYIALIWHKLREAPVDAHFMDLKFSAYGL